MADFWQSSCDYNSIDMGCSGYLFMWSNRYFGLKKLIGERVDRFLYSHCWQDLNIFSSTSHLTSWAFDHWWVLLEVRD